jgi:hypothetical protein
MPPPHPSDLEFETSEVAFPNSKKCKIKSQRALENRFFSQGTHVGQKDAQGSRKEIPFI